MRFCLIALALIVALARVGSAQELSPRLIAEIVASSLSPVDSGIQTRAALAAAARGLGRMKEADLAIVLPADLIVDHATQSVGTAASGTVSDFDVELEEGRIRLSGTILLDDGEARLQAKITGRLDLEVVEKTLILWPAIEEIQVLDLRLGDGLQRAIVEVAARRVLTRAPERISAVIGQFIPPIPLTFDALEIDLAAELQALEPVQSVEAPKLTLTMTPEDPVLFVAPEAVYILARLPGSTATRSKTDRAPEVLYEEVHAAVLSEIRRLVGTELEGGGVAVSKRAAADYLNAALPGKRPLISVRIAGTVPGPVPVDEKIELAGGNFSCEANRDCGQTRDCRRGTKDCSQPHDTRNCRACLVRRPWDGGCAVWGNDPTCEAQKAAQNAAYAAVRGACEAENATRKGICEAEKEAARLDCERIKAQKTLECETKRVVQSLLAEFGGVGAISGQLTLDYGADVAIPTLAFTADLGLEADIEAVVTARVNGPLTFTPHDLAGHIVCTSKWRRDLALDVTARTLDLSISAGIGFESGKPALVVEFEPVTVNAQSAPPLRDFLERHPDLRVICSGLNLLDLTNDALQQVTDSAIHPVLAGRYKIDLPAMRIAEELQDLSLELEGGRLNLTPVNLPAAIAFVPDR